MAPSGPPLDDEGHLLLRLEARDLDVRPGGGMRFIFQRLDDFLPDVGISSDEESEDEDEVGIPGELLDFLLFPVFGPPSSDEEEDETEDEETGDEEEEDEDSEGEDSWDDEEDSEDSWDEDEDDPGDPLVQWLPPEEFWRGWRQQDPAVPPAAPPPPEDLPSGSAPSTSGLSVSTKRSREEDDTDQVGMKRQRRTSEEDSDSD